MYYNAKQIEFVSEKNVCASPNTSSIMASELLEITCKILHTLRLNHEFNKQIYNTCFNKIEKL